MCLSFSPFEAQNSLFLLPVQVRSTSRLDKTQIKCMHQWFSSLNVIASNKKEIFVFIIYFGFNVFICKCTHITLHFFIFFFLHN